MILTKNDFPYINTIIMEIQKIFSDYEGEERLYSVLMDEEELILFSELQKEFNSKAQKALRKAWEESHKSFKKPAKYISEDFVTKLNPNYEEELRKARREVRKQNRAYKSSKFYLDPGEQTNHEIFRGSSPDDRIYLKRFFKEKVGDHERIDESLVPYHSSNLVKKSQSIHRAMGL